MKNLSRSRRWIQHWLFVAAAAAFLIPGIASAATKVVELRIEGGIGAATADYIEAGFEHAREVSADMILLTMATPGGLSSSMRDIITEILNSDIPVVTYVSPEGARAASAGTYILLASHVAAMAPTTVTGAATPVNLGGEDATPPRLPFDPEAEEESNEAEKDEDSDSEALPGTAMQRKVMNDSVSYIRSLAERHGRNADWAEKAVVEAATLTAREALEANVIDIVASDHDDLFAQVNGREVEVDGETVVVDTASVDVEEFEPGWRLKLLAVIAQPEILVLLLGAGIYGLILEGWNPGAIVPGVVGVICLLLAAYALQVLPVNYAGIALILVGIALMVAEAFAPSFGALGIGGIAAFTFGAIMAFDSGVPGFGISIAFVLTMAVASALFLIWVIGYMVKLQNRGAVSGAGSIIGGIGTAMSDFTGDGKIWLEGEAWHARSAAPLIKDQEVVVTAMDGLVLVVRPATDAPREDAALQT